MARILADVMILGGGPAGCMAAAGCLAADPGLSVVIVDPAPGGKHRIGEALLTGTVMTLDDAGMADEVAAAGFHPKIGAAYRWGETRDTWYVNYPEGDGSYPEAFREDGQRRAIHVARHEYDALLQRIVAARGAEIVAASAAAVSLEQTARGPMVKGVTLSDGREAWARHYVDCTGQASFLGRRTGDRRRVGEARIARYAYTRSVDWDLAARHGFDPRRTNIVSGPNGWLWAIHLGEAGDGLTSFGFVSTPDTLAGLTMENCAETFPDASLFGFAGGMRDPMTFDGKPTDRFYGHPDYSYASERLHGPNWSLAGDASLFIDPILSQGVTLATHYGFLRGRAAAAAVAGLEGADDEVTKHYRREAAVMSDVVGKWYANNRSVAGWKMQSVAKAQDLYGLDMNPDAAFRWITNLENIRDEYDPYPPSERKKVDAMLGLGG